MAVLDGDKVTIEGKPIEITGFVNMKDVGISNTVSPIYQGGLNTRNAINSDITKKGFEITIMFAKTYTNIAVIKTLNEAGITNSNYKMTIGFQDGTTATFDNVFALEGPNVEGGSNTIESTLSARKID